MTEARRKTSSIRASGFLRHSDFVLPGLLSMIRMAPIAIGFEAIKILANFGNVASVGGSG